jgi:hypothetical protein
MPRNLISNHSESTTPRLVTFKIRRQSCFMGEQTSYKNTVEFEAWVYQKTRFWPQLPDYYLLVNMQVSLFFPFPFFTTFKNCRRKFTFRGKFKYTGPFNSQQNFVICLGTHYEDGIVTNYKTKQKNPQSGRYLPHQILIFLYSQLIQA